MLWERLSLTNAPARIRDGYAAGAGLALSGTTFSATPYQAGSGLALSGATFSATPYLAGSGITLTGSTFSVTPGSFVPASGGSVAGNLAVSGSMQVGTSATCDGNTRGAIRWTGSVFEGCTTNGWESLSTASTTPTTPSGPAWTQLQGPPQTFANDTWNGVQFSSAPIATTSERSVAA